MGTSFALTKESRSLKEDHRWLRSVHGTRETRSITLDGPSFFAVFTDGIVPSGVHLSFDPDLNKHVPYSGVTEETQTLTIDATGGTYTLTFEGDETAAIAFNATAATIEAELEGLDSIGAGNVSVTGDPGGPYTVRFIGDLADTDQPLITTDATNLTGGAGTAVVAEAEAGGAADDLPCVGILYTTNSVRRGTDERVTVDVTAPMLWHGEVIEANLPALSGVDADAKADLTHVDYV